MRALHMTMSEPQARFFQLQAQYPLFCGGYGTGKTETMINCAIRDALEAPGCLIALYEPSYDIIKLALMPRMEERLADMGLRYTLNKTDKFIKIRGGRCADFIMRTLDNPAAIVAYESYCAHIDEIDVLNQDQAQLAWRKILARNRQKPAHNPRAINRVSAYTTPEGFKFAYDRWVRKKQEGDGYEMVQASTLSNVFIDAEEYVVSLRKDYPPQLIQAYVEGKFVNMTSGSVYPDFDRKLNHSPSVMEPSEPLHVGMDFNVHKMAAVIFVVREDTPHAVAEIVNARDTPTMARLLKERYPEHSITIYPDSAAQGTSSKDAAVSDLTILQKNGFTIRARSAHAPVKDRINCVNALILNSDGQRRLRVNTDFCPRWTESLEQQTYDNHGEPDKKSGLDHPNDAAGYFLEQRWPVVKPVATHGKYIPHIGR